MNAVLSSHFSHVWLFAMLWTVSCQTPLSMGFSRQEYWSELQRPPPGDLPDPGSKPISMSPALASGFFTTSATWEAPVNAIAEYKRTRPRGCWLWNLPFTSVEMYNIFNNEEWGWNTIKQSCLYFFSLFLRMMSISRHNTSFQGTWELLWKILSTYSMNQWAGA